MATKETLRLHGWSSPFARRVELALKLKGIPYEYVEENWEVKSEQLLRYNPVHKKIPVLVHNERPLCESLIIIEYIEETWKNSIRLLPEDAYERAKVHFWASFIDLKLLEQLRTILNWRREEDIEEMRENLDKLEGNMKDIFPEGILLSKGTKMELLDILMCTFAPIIEAFDEAMNTRFLIADKHRSIITWMKAFDGLEIVKQTTPSHEELVKFFKDYKPKSPHPTPIEAGSRKEESASIAEASCDLLMSQVQVPLNSDEDRVQIQGAFEDENRVCVSVKDA